MGRRYALVVVALTCATVLVLVVGGVTYTRHAQQEADRRWCDLLVTIDRPDRPIPPTGDPARDAENKRAQQKMHQLTLDLGCYRKRER